MFWNLLTASSSSSSGSSGSGCNVVSFLPWLLILGAVVVMWFFGKRSQQKQQEQINATLDAIQPGSKVKTIGGICGVVVELCPDEDAFILETGSETTGKSYIKFDKKAVYQTDAVPASEQPADETPVEGEVKEEFFEEAEAEEEVTAEEKAEETTEEVAEAPADETEGE